MPMDTQSDKKCPRGKLHCFNYLSDVPGGYADFDIVEVQFKNTRKGFYRNSLNLPLETGDMVAVEASPGHDIGKVTLTGRLVALQMKRAGIKSDAEIKRVFRKAKPADLEKYEEAKSRENDTMIRARKIAESLLLNMKIGDVEYQGDGNKAIFYYIADERVDFRQLIKVLAETFKVRIEMKQIGARQEAGRIGGLGSCGRELCCASWISGFVSVTTNSARHQEISLNPQKLAGQCGKLKCCLIYELDTYLDARKEIPRVNQPLQTLEGDYYLVKTDILSRTMWFSSDPHSQAAMYPLNVERVREIIRANQKGRKVEQLDDSAKPFQQEEPTFADVVGEESLTRFDRQKEGRRKNRKKKNKTGGKEASPAGTPSPQRSAQPEKSAGAAPRNEASDSSGRNAERKGAPRRDAPKDAAPKQPKAAGQGASAQARPDNGAPAERRKEGGNRRNNNNRRRRNPHANNAEQHGKAGQTGERPRKPSGE